MFKGKEMIDQQVQNKIKEQYDAYVNYIKTVSKNPEKDTVSFLEFCEIYITQKGV